MASVSSARAFVQQDGHDHTGNECERSNRTDRPYKAEEIIDEPRRQGTNGIAKVAPETIDAQRTWAFNAISQNDVAIKLFVAMTILVLGTSKADSAEREGFCSGTRNNFRFGIVEFGFGELSDEAAWGPVVETAWA